MKKDITIIKTENRIFVLKPLDFRKFSHYSEMRNDALMHRQGLKG